MVRRSALLLLLGCPGTDGEGPPGKDTGDTGDAGPSPLTGNWEGEVAGYANFGGDWEAEPYCAGTVDVVVAADGSVTGVGDCTALWGPYMGLVFVATVSGSGADDGGLSLPIALVDDEAAHPWDDCTLAGTADPDARTGSAGCDTLYHPLGFEPVDAIITLTLN